MSIENVTTRRKPNVRQTDGICKQCREPFGGRPDKWFCSDRCRTKFGREQKAGLAESGRARFARAVRELLAAANVICPGASKNIDERVRHE
jgi:hypothetical protein